MNVKRNLIAVIVVLLTLIGTSTAFGQNNPIRPSGSYGSGNSGAATSNSGSGSAANGTVTPTNARTLEAALEAVGSLSSSNLYFLYVSLRMLGDGFSNKIYDAKVASSLATNLHDFAQLSSESLRKLDGDPLIASNDSQMITKLTDAYDLLQKLADGLQSFIDKTDDGSKFRTYSQSAWEKIADVLGLSAGTNTGPAGAAGGSANPSGGPSGTPSGAGSSSGSSDGSAGPSGGSGN